MIQIINLGPSSQTTKVTIDGIIYNVNVIWRQDTYILDLYDVNNNPVVTGIPLITGADLMGQLKYLSIPGYWVIANADGSDTPPTYNNLGVSSFLLFIYN